MGKACVLDAHTHFTFSGSVSFKNFFMKLVAEHDRNTNSTPYGNTSTQTHTE